MKRRLNYLPNEKAEHSFAAKLRGFGPVGSTSIAIIVAVALFAGPLAPIVVLAWAWAAHVRPAELGFARPRSWIATIGGGIGAGVVLKVLLKTAVMPLLGAPPINANYHFVVGDAAALWRMIFIVIITAGFGEEILFRGYLFERLRRLFGTSAVATAGIAIFTSALFALAHLPDQGLFAAEQAAITGMTFALMYIATRSLWLSIVAHASFDVAALLIIYLELERPLASLFYG